MSHYGRSQVIAAQAWWSSTRRAVSVLMAVLVPWHAVVSSFDQFAGHRHSHAPTVIDSPQTPARSIHHADVERSHVVHSHASEHSHAHVEHSHANGETRAHVEHAHPGEHSHTTAERHLHSPHDASVVYESDASVIAPSGEGKRAAVLFDDVAMPWVLIAVRGRTVGARLLALGSLKSIARGRLERPPRSHR